MKTLFANKKNSVKNNANFEVLSVSELNNVKGGGESNDQPGGGSDTWGLPPRK
ncbi:MAG: bacteriocin [Bacteroidota bacterium]|nr:bacteriocin [Bacteroidota bacterium]